MEISATRDGPTPPPLKEITIKLTPTEAQELYQQLNAVSTTDENAVMGTGALLRMWVGLNSYVDMSDRYGKYLRSPRYTFS